MGQNDYVFNSKADKEKYINETFQTEYIDFVKKQENEINKDEKLKRNLQTTYFKDNKDK